MRRALLHVTLLAWAGALSGQAADVLRITVTVVDDQGRTTPVGRHTLLVSDDPPTAPPRVIVTAGDGTATVKLRPGRYTVDSERPVAFQGRVYQWSTPIVVVSGREAVLVLTADNADSSAVAPDSANAATSLETAPSFLLPEWQASVVALWTTTSRASGFLIDAKGLIATSQRAVGTASAVEVQFSPAVKVAARVLAADEARDVAVLWIDPGVAASISPVPLACTPPTHPPFDVGQALFTIGAPLREPKSLVAGAIDDVTPRSLAADFRLPSGGAGGPVFATSGALVGLTSIVADDAAPRRAEVRVIRVEVMCEVVEAAAKQMERIPRPIGTRLPVEPARAARATAPQDSRRAAGNVSPAQMSSSDFDIAFITPALLDAAEAELSRRQGRQAGALANDASNPLRFLTEFSNWSEYVAERPPVLMIRVRPKFEEGFWTKVARGAARTQGMVLPPIKRFKAGFSRMTVTCGAADVTPIHPFVLEHGTPDAEGIREGLYVFAPDALGPHCGHADLVLYSEKVPDKGDRRRVAPAVLQRLWQDLAPYRPTR